MWERMITHRPRRVSKALKLTRHHSLCKQQRRRHHSHCSLTPRTETQKENEAKWGDLAPIFHLQTNELMNSLQKARPRSEKGMQCPTWVAGTQSRHIAASASVCYKELDQQLQQTQTPARPWEGSVPRRALLSTPEADLSRSDMNVANRTLRQRVHGLRREGKTHDPCF